MTNDRCLMGFIEIPELRDFKSIAQLHINQNNQLTVSFFTEKSLGSRDLRLLIGNFEPIGEVTFINSELKSFGGTNWGPYYYKYSPQIMILGFCFQTVDEIIFQSFALVCPSLINWYCPNSYHYKIVKPNTCFTPIKNNHSLPRNQKIVFKNYLVENFINKSHSIQEKLKIEFSRTNKDVYYLRDVLKNLWNFQRLLLFLSNNYYQPESLLAFNSNWPKHGITGERPVIKIHLNKRVIADHKLEIQHAEIKEDFANVIFNWFDSINEYDHLIDSVLTFYILPNSSRKTYFLNAASAFEGLAKHLFASKGTLSHIIKDNCHITKKFYNVENDWFIKTCVNTRNFLAHGKKDGKKELFDDFEMLYAAKCLLNIARYWYMKKLGISPSFLEEKLEICSQGFNEMRRVNKGRKNQRIDLDS